jgi:hypothetical protein
MFLIFQKKRLEVEYTAADYGIGNAHEVEIRMRVKGGKPISVQIRPVGDEDGSPGFVLEIDETRPMLELWTRVARKYDVNKKGHELFLFVKGVGDERHSFENMRQSLKDAGITDESVVYADTRLVKEGKEPRVLEEKESKDTLLLVHLPGGQSFYLEVDLNYIFEDVMQKLIILHRVPMDRNFHVFVDEVAEDNEVTDFTAALKCLVFHNCITFSFSFFFLQWEIISAKKSVLLTKKRVTKREEWRKRGKMKGRGGRV